MRNFAGYTLTIPHKVMAAHLCDELLPNARACGAVNAVRIDSDGRLIGETFDGLGMVRGHYGPACPRRRYTGPTGRCRWRWRAIAVALALAGVGSLAITNRTQAKADDLAAMVRRAAPCLYGRGRDGLQSGCVRYYY